MLTDEERMAMGREQAREAIDWAQTEAAKKIAAADFGARIKAHNKEITRLSRIVDSGIEFRAIECAARFDYYLGRVTITRTDTGDVMESRPLTHAEMQRKLDLDE